MQIVKSFSKVNFMNLGGITDFSPLCPDFRYQAAVSAALAWEYEVRLYLWLTRCIEEYWTTKRLYMLYGVPKGPPNVCM